MHGKWNTEAIKTKRKMDFCLILIAKLQHQMVSYRVFCRMCTMCLTFSLDVYFLLFDVEIAHETLFYE